MRRRLPLILISILAAVVTFLALILFFGRPPAPFEFLRDHRPLASKLNVRPGAVLYSFEADYPSLAKRAKAELESKGYLCSEAKDSSGKQMALSCIKGQMQLSSGPSKGLSPA